MHGTISVVSYFRLIPFLLCIFLQNLTLIADGFVAGTVVATANGLVPIELLQPEQRVLCASPRGNILPRPIVSISTICTDQIIELTFEGNVTVAMSPHQRIYSMSRESWIEAEDLCVGDRVYTIRGTEAEIASVDRKHEQVTLYVPTIQSYHNLFISPCGIFAHNAAIAAAALSACAIEIIEAITYTLVAIAAAREVQDFYEERRLKKELEELSEQLEEEIRSTEDFDDDEQEEFRGDEDSEELDYAMENEITQEAPDEKTPAKTVEEILEDTVPGEKTKGKSEIFVKEGGYPQAKEDFDSLDLTGIFDIPTGEVGYLPDGRKVIVRTKSEDTRPTLEIQRPGSKRKIKIRYNP